MYMRTSTTAIVVGIDECSDKHSSPTRLASAYYCYCGADGRAVRAYNTAMGWLRLVGSIKLKVSFAEYSLFYRALLQRKPIILSILPT